MSSPVVFEDVARVFDGKPVLRGLSFDVLPGESYALLGRNGAGKTTALRILLGFQEAHAGTARVLGSSSAALSPKLRERIGYVSEGHRLPSFLRVCRLLDHETATRARFDRAFVEAALKRLEIDRKASVGKLSRGQQALLSLLLAVAGSPDLLVFDDPALGLDAVARRELIEVLIELLAERKVTLLLSSHALADVERLADRVGILHRGRLIVDASVDELRRRVHRRFLKPRPDAAENGALAAELAASQPGVLRGRRVAGGVELTLLDADDQALARLAALAAALSDPLPVSLEELFVDLTADQATAFGRGLFDLDDARDDARRRAEGGSR